jgi:hypothetical protein
MNKTLKISSWTKLYNYKNYFRVRELNKVVKKKTGEI